MAAVYYPFIDIAVHERVRQHYTAGDALALFSADLAHVLWANGAGARLFGTDSVYDFIEQGPARNAIFFRQFETAARQIGASGESRNFAIRTVSGFRTVTTAATAEMLTLAGGETAILFAAAVNAGGGDLAARAQQMLSGLDEPDTHMAVLDGEGAVIAASSGYGQLGITPHTARTLVALAANEPGRLVKRPVSTARGHLPAATARLSDEPALNLLFAVETAIGEPVEEAAAPEPQPAPPLAASEEGAGEEDDFADLPPVSAAAPASGDDFETVLSAVSDIEEIEEPETEAEESDGAPQPAPAEEVPAAAADAEAKPAAPGGFTFDPDRRAFRFVWKTDAEGRFSEVSGEFADAVGPHSADIKGQSFIELAERYCLDPEGRIAEALARRDTWSGRTIHWPVEGTRLKVPVDLAALPAYSRAREFDGFRGFGIVRPADVVEDPQALGLTLFPQAETEEEEAAPQPETDAHETGATGGGEEAAHEALADEDAPAPAESAEEAAAGGEEDDSAPDGETEAEAETDAGARENDAGRAVPEDEASEAAVPEDVAPENAAPEDAPETPMTGETEAGPDEAPEWPEGEPPALRLSDVPGRRLSDKIIRLEERRARTESLTPGEEAAFREIARKLDPFAKSDDGATEPGSGEEPVFEDAAEAIAAAPEPVAGEEDASAAPANVEALGALIPPRTHQAEGLSPGILAQMPVALLVLSGDALIHANPEFLRLTGYDSLEALSAVGGLDALLQRDELEGKTEAPGGMMVVRADDGIVPVTARLQSIRFEGATALMLALMPVETAAPEPKPKPEPAEAAPAASSEIARLRIEAEELRSILETATDGVVILGSEGDIRSMNRSASALFNYDNEETRGKPFVMLFAHESQRAVADYLAGLSGNGVASVLNDGREVIGREASGGFLPLFMTIGKLTSSNGYCAVIRDITQWKRSEEELRNAKRAAETANAHKTDFLARVSHEIRTPLNAIIGFADILASEHFGPAGHPRYVEYANDIGRSGRHVLDIVNDLLDISKIEAGEMDLDFTAVNLNDTVAEAVSLVQPQANGQRVIIRTALSQSVPQVVADQRSIKQIVLNILANSIRFTPSGGQIVVSTVYEPSGGVSLRIRDTGIGMTRAELEQAMKPFRQVTSGREKRGEGTGLGLPLTKAMADANRAAFTIQSSPNEGTLVEIAFPPQRVLAN